VKANFSKLHKDLSLLIQLPDAGDRSNFHEQKINCADWSSNPKCSRFNHEMHLTAPGVPFAFSRVFQQGDEG
jgi:hypothetical protein